MKSLLIDESLEVKLAIEECLRLLELLAVTPPIFKAPEQEVGQEFHLLDARRCPQGLLQLL